MAGLPFPPQSAATFLFSLLAALNSPRLPFSGHADIVAPFYQTSCAFYKLLRPIMRVAAVHSFPLLLCMSLLQVSMGVVAACVCGLNGTFRVSARDL